MTPYVIFRLKTFQVSQRFAFDLIYLHTSIIHNEKKPSKSKFDILLRMEAQWMEG